MHFKVESYNLIYRNFKSYNSNIDNDKFEDAFNQLFIWPYLEIIANNLIIEDVKHDTATESQWHHY